MAGQGNRALGALSDAANRVVAENARAFARLSGAGLTLEERARRPLDFAAKEAVARKIADEELRRANGAHNDIGDAERHARWSERTAKATGPLYAEAAGILHEAKNFYDSVREHGLSGPYDRQDRGPTQPRGLPTPGETLDEIQMDLHNNAEGRRAAREGRAIDPSRLQTAPRTPAYAPLYRSPASGVTFSGRR